MSTIIYTPDRARDQTFMAFHAEDGILMYRVIDNLKAEEHRYQSRWLLGTPVLYFGSSSVWPQDGVLTYG